jgi:hypothetical protein
MHNNMRKRIILPFVAGIFLSSYLVALALLILIFLSEPKHTLLDGVNSFFAHDFLGFVFFFNLPPIMLSVGTVSCLSWHHKAENAYKRLAASKGDHRLFWFVLGLVIPLAYAIFLFCTGLVSLGLAYFFPARRAWVFLSIIALLALVLLEETPTIVFRLAARAPPALYRPHSQGQVLFHNVKHWPAAICPQS